jgi:hypothetical protein
MRSGSAGRAADTLLERRQDLTGYNERLTQSSDLVDAAGPGGWQGQGMRRGPSPLVARLTVIVVLALTGAGILAGCGGSSKPAYCSDLTNFKNAVAQIKTTTSSPSALVSQLKTVASTGQAAISAVKTNLAPETTAVKNSLAALENSAKQLTSSSTRGAAITAIPSEVDAVRTAADNLDNAAKQCK